MKRLMFSLILMLGVGIGIGLVSSIFGGADTFRASPAKADIVDKGGVTISKSANDFLTNETKSDNGEFQATISDTPIEIVRGLNVKALEYLTPGWVHIRDEIVFDTDEDDNGILPNGVAIPNQHTLDSWFHLNDEMLVVESVTIMRTMDGEIVQVGVYKNGTMWNSATDELYEREPSSVENLDAGFINDMLRMKDLGIEPFADTLKQSDGTEQIQITMSEKFEMPLDSSDYKKPMTSAETLVLFNKETGYLLQKVIKFSFEDGTTRTFLKMSRKITQEHPTDEVIKFLDNNK